MIPRYEKKEISRVWSDDYKFESMLKVELAILRSLEGNQVPKGTADQIEKNAKIDPDRIVEIERETKHDIIAFCTSITENLPANVGKYFHFGVTSSDIIDSGMTLQIRESLKEILPVFEELLSSLKSRAEEMKDVVCLGRSHGMYAEPMSFGVKLLGHYAEFKRRYEDLKDFYDNELTIQFSGAVGNYTILTAEQEKTAADSLGLKVEPVSTQVIPRDRVAKLVSIGALIGSAVERIAVEIRHLHRSDVDELHEGFSKGQKGSSTMPHKKNPISGENLSGIARVLRSHVSIALENIVLWHERDISHSSAERLFLPDHLGLLHYSLSRLNGTIKNLVFHNEKIENRVKETFVYLSSYYLHQLIEKTDFTREDLYKLVQQAAFDSQGTQSAEKFYEGIQNLLGEKGVKLDLPKPDFAEIKKIYLRETPQIFERTLN